LFDANDESAGVQKLAMPCGLLSVCGCYSVDVHVVCPCTHIWTDFYCWSWGIKH